MPDKFTPSTEDKLEDALALLAAGVPMSEILAEAGDDALWLRPLLETAGDVGGLRFAINVPPPEASLQRMLAYGQELAAVSPTSAPMPSRWLELLAGLLRGRWLPRLAMGLVSALFVLVLLGGTLTALAQRSLPGQPLYRLKRAQETLRLSLTGDPNARIQLRENYNRQRLREAQLLLEQNQTASVDFYGRLETVTGASVKLNGLTLQLTPQTKVVGHLATGAQVEVEVLTQPPDRLLALTLTVVEPPPPLPVPTPTATFTPVPSPTAINTRSLSSATDTLILPTATPLPPTATPTSPPPTATATPLAPTSTSPPLPAENDNNNPTGGDNTGNNNDNTGEHNGDDGGDNSGPGSSGNDNSDGGGEHSSGDDNSGSGGGGDNSGSGGGNSGSGGGGGDNSGSGGGGGGGSD